MKNEVNRQNPKATLHVNPQQNPRKALHENGLWKQHLNSFFGIKMQWLRNVREINEGRVQKTEF